MRYFISFLFSLTLFLNPVLKAASNDVDNTNGTEGKIYTDTKEQAGSSENSSYLPVSYTHLTLPTNREV